MELRRDSKVRGKDLEEKRVKKTLDSKIQKMKERDELRKTPQGM